MDRIKNIHYCLDLNGLSSLLVNKIVVDNPPVEPGSYPQGIVPVFVYRSCSQDSLIESVYKRYRFIALPPSAPSTAEATAIIALRMISQADFFIAIIFPPPFRGF